MKRHPKKDPVTPEDRLAVLIRDGYRCVGPALALRAGVEHPGPCRNVFGADMESAYGYRIADLQIDHVRDTPGGMRISDPRWLQALCPRCHLDGFATRKDIRAAARERLARLYDGEEPTDDVPLGEE